MTDLRKAAETMLFRLLGDENHDIRLRAAIALLQTPVQPKREWVGLTDEEIDAAVKSCNTLDTYKYFRAIEAKLKEKNT